MAEQFTCYNCGHVNSTTSQFCANCGAALLLQQRYHVVGVLGQGGFGVVYDAQDARLNRRCAIKQVKSASEDEERQVKNEMDILAQHASRYSFIPMIYDTWSERQQTYMVMEFVDGPTLNDLPLPWGAQEVEKFLRVMLANLAQLHDAGIVHRDLKPQNIKHTPQGRSPYMLLDFGIAKRGGVTSVKAYSPDYTPPEQMQGLSTDARSDLYSLAATAYFLLNERSPLKERAMRQGALPAAHEFASEAPPALKQTLLHMLQNDPQQRPPDARAALNLLDKAPPIHEQATERVPPPVALPAPDQARARAPVPQQAPPAEPPARPTIPIPQGDTAPREQYRAVPPPEPVGRSPIQSRMLGIIIGVIALLLLAGVAAAALTGQLGGGSPAAESETATPTSIVTAEATAEATPEPEATSPAPPSSTELPPTELPPTAPPPLPTAPPPQPGAQLAFASNMQGDFDIFVVDTNGENLRALTEHPANDYSPAWSPDGSRIAFHSERDERGNIYLVNSDGSGLTRLSSDAFHDREPVWSPDGSRIAFYSEQRARDDWDIIIMNADGSNQQNLTADSYSADFLPAWSPDGSRIAFTSNRDGNDEIYVMGTDGRNLRRLTEHPANDKWPAWSPDSQSIAFTSYREGEGQIYIMDADGSNLRNISLYPLAEDSQPAWSPDGSRIAFTRTRDGNAEIYTMNADGSDVRQVTSNGATNWDAVWSP